MAINGFGNFPGPLQCLFAWVVRPEVAGEQHFATDLLWGNGTIFRFLNDAAKLLQNRLIFPLIYFLENDNAHVVNNQGDRATVQTARKRQEKPSGLGFSEVVPQKQGGLITSVGEVVLIDQFADSFYFLRVVCRVVLLTHCHVHIYSNPGDHFYAARGFQKRFVGKSECPNTC